MDIRGEIVAIYEDETRKNLNFRGYVDNDEDGMSNVVIQTVYDESGNYMDTDNIMDYEIINYKSE